jgi:glycosyltransferase involved in cell wall biosynthesis
VNRQLRILQVFNRYLKPGGEEKSVARIADDLEDGGHNVTRFWRESAEWRMSNAPPRLKQLILMWRNPPVLSALQQAHKETGADLWILHNVVPVISLGVYRLAKELKVPIIQWLHNYRPISVSGTLFAGGKLLKPDDPWLAWKETWHGTWNGRLPTACLACGYSRLKHRHDFNSVKAWVAVSEQMRLIFAQAGWFEERLHTLRHSWHVGDNAGNGADEGYFLFLGRMVESKGVGFLVDLWKDPRLREVELVMAGDGPLTTELRRQSPPNVRWVGHVEGAEKEKLKRGCRAILFPSIWPEPLSTVAYEAYEMNKPIVSSDLGGMPELVLHGQTGFLLPAGKRESWLDKIMELSRDPCLCQGLGVRGRQWLEQEVSASRWRAQFSVIAERALTT